MVTVLPRSNPAEDLRSRALDPESLHRPDPVPRYEPRSKHLPDAAQTYVQTPGYRGYRGACGGCGAPEEKFCPSSCVQIDPLGRFNALPRMRRCARCEDTIKRDRIGVDVIVTGTLLVLTGAPVIHVVLLGRPTSLCGLVHRAGAVEYLTL